MVVERVVDYLQASFFVSEQSLIMKGFPAVPPIRFYKRGYLHPLGFRLYFGNPKSKKASLVGAGDCMHGLRCAGYLDAEVLDWVLSKGAIVSRLDLAVTDFIEDELLMLEDIEGWFVHERIESPLVTGGMKEISEILPDGERERQTIYIGDIEKRGRKGIFRAYDKGIEMGIGSEIATRIELELKAKNAHSVARRLAETNDVAGNFRSKFNVRTRDFERVMDTDAVTFHRGKNQVKEGILEENNKRWDWLLNQVAPALKKAIQEDRMNDLGDVRLQEFISRCGLLKEINAGVVAAAQKMSDNYFASIGIKNRKFSSEELD